MCSRKHSAKSQRGLAELQDTLFSCEVRSSLNEGLLTVRYGLQADSGEGQPYFRLDMDRFIEEAFDTAQLAAKLGAFADDIYAVFRAAAGPALVDWMDRG